MGKRVSDILSLVGSCILWLAIGVVGIAGAAGAFILVYVCLRWLWVSTGAHQFLQSLTYQEWVMGLVISYMAMLIYYLVKDYLAYQRQQRELEAYSTLAAIVASVVAWMWIVSDSLARIGFY